METVRLTIDGMEVEVPAGSTVLEAAAKAGVFIPTLCHDPELSALGACRLCVVEIPGMRNLPAACVTQVTPGMEVHTSSPAVIEARRTILELLLAGHPEDCLTCEKAGDCRLQDYAYLYGVRRPSFGGEKRDYPPDDSHPFILRDAGKCILWAGACGSARKSRGEASSTTPTGALPPALFPPLTCPFRNPAAYPAAAAWPSARWERSCPGK